jgi:hypothetical protein
MAADWLQDNPARLTAYWLVPAAPDHEYLADRIRTLAEAQDATPFEPHVTLAVTTLDPDDAQGLVLEKLSRSFAPFDAATGSAQHTDQRFKSLYLPIESTVIPLMHRQVLSLARSATSDAAFDPHLSLLYKILPASERIRLARTEPASGRRVRFDRVAVILPARGDSDFSDVSGWRVAESRPLSGPLD